MKDIIIDEKCPVCGESLALRESINQKGELWLVKYCKARGCIPVQEIAELKQK